MIDKKKGQRESIYAVDVDCGCMHAYIRHLDRRWNVDEDDAS